MADSSVVLNAGASGASAATFTDSGVLVHQKVVLEWQDGTAADPKKVNLTNPLPSGLVFSGSLLALGQATMAASLPVTLASNQSALPAAQSGTWTVQQGTPPWTFKPDGTAWTMTGTSANVNVTNASIAVTGTFWQATQPVSGTITANQGAANATPWNNNIAQVGGTAFGLGQGLMAASLSVAIASNQSAIPVAQSGAWTFTEVPTAGTGASVNSQLLTASGVINANIKASAGTIYSVDVTNNNTTPVFVRLYDKATAPATTDTPIWRGIVPGGSAAAGLARVFGQGLKTTAGIGIRITGLIADNDATNVNNVIANVEYA